MTVLVAAIAELRVAIVAFFAGIDEGIAAIRVAKIGRNVWATWQGNVRDERRRDVWAAWQGNVRDERRRNVWTAWQHNVWAGRRCEIRSNSGVGDRSLREIPARVGRSGEREIRSATGEFTAREKEQANAKPPIRRPHAADILLYSG